MDVKRRIDKKGRANGVLLELFKISQLSSLTSQQKGSLGLESQLNTADIRNWELGGIGSMEVVLLGAGRFKLSPAS